MLNLQKTLLINEVLELLNLISVYKYLKGACDRTRGSGHKLKHRRLHLKTRKHFFFYGLVTEHWAQAETLWGLCPWRY